MRNELLDTQLESYQLLQAFFPLPNEIIVSLSSSEFLETYDGTSLPSISALEITLSLELDFGSIQLLIQLPFHAIPPTKTMSVVLQQSSSLSRAQFEILHSLILNFLESNTLETNAEIILELSNHLKEAKVYVEEVKPAVMVEELRKEDEIRVYFYLISLSTREKRDDIVNWSKDFNCTGFVLAGKPGLLCLEGTSTNIDLFMKDIKSISWADIPSHQKKITEKFREPITTRLFTAMTEITDLFEKGGFRGNRNDLVAVREWLKAQGVDEKVFFEVLGI